MEVTKDSFEEQPGERRRGRNKCTSAAVLLGLVKAKHQTNDDADAATTTKAATSTTSSASASSNNTPRTTPKFKRRRTLGNLYIFLYLHSVSYFVIPMIHLMSESTI